MLFISSRDNPRIKLLAALGESARERRKLGQTLLDGPHLLGCMLDAGILPAEVCVSMSGSKRAEIASLLARLPAALEPLCVPDALFARIATVETPTGILARIAIPSPSPPAAERAAGSVVILDAVQDPGNLGGILRSSAAAGINALWLTPGCAQAWSPKVLRAGMGAHFRLSIIEQADALALLDAFPGKALATSPTTGARELYHVDLTGPVAWLFGAEGQGVSAPLLARATETVTIPMASGIESLNVGAAVAVCLFEQMRQRRARRDGQSCA
ncbi:MAG: RNA methyltransferase [Zoogloeaceae bacterium]|jgi:TrmH family RNA methyltransferase|nr:RNA methyltransferase [Zoogloeaceae bacterium]